ncbi:hypothetical protein HDU97_007190 [Phlyctochytrium planicorne]|nr:hypothetical protein HDU97_007190 [Phlyctochytrium planicorne]
MADHSQLAGLSPGCSSKSRLIAVTSLTVEIVVLVFVAKVNTVPMTVSKANSTELHKPEEGQIQSGPKPLAFTSIEMLVCVSVFKLILSAFFYKYFSRQQKGVPNLSSFAFLGVLYGILNVIGYGPYNAERYFSPSDSRIVSILLVPAVMFCFSLEQFDIVRLLSIGFLVAATRAVGAFLATPEDPYNYIFVATYAILRVYHSMELKKNPGVSVHIQNMVLSVFTICTYLAIYGLEGSKAISLQIKTPNHGISQGIQCIVVTLLQSLVEIVASINYKKANAIVTEFSMTLASLLVAIATSHGEIFEVIYMKAIALGLAVAAVLQYFRGPYQYVPEGQTTKLGEKSSSDDEEEPDDLDSYFPASDDELENNKLEFDLSRAIAEELDDEKLKEKPKPSHDIRYRLDDKFRRKISKNVPFLILILLTLGHFPKNNPDICKPVETVPTQLNLDISRNESEYPSNQNKLFYEKGVTLLVATDFPSIQVERMLLSFEKFCVDCDKVKFLFVVSGDMADAQRLKTRFSFIKKLEIASFQQAYQDLNEPIDVYSENRLLEEKGHPTFHSFRRMAGCLYANTTYCWMMHPESFMIKKTSVADLVLEYFRNPYIVYSSNSRSSFGPLRSATNILGYREHFGWPIEEYFWIMETSIIRRIRDIIDYKFPTPHLYPSDMYFEILYYVYIIHNLHRYPQYRLVDSSDIYGDLWEEGLKQAAGLSPIEDLRLVLSRNASMIPDIAKSFVAHNIRFYRATDGGLYGDKETSSKFLDLATTVHVVSGSQMFDMVNMAIDGRWSNKTL